MHVQVRCRPAAVQDDQQEQLFVPAARVPHLRAPQGRHPGQQVHQVGGGVTVLGAVHIMLIKRVSKLSAKR